MSDDKTQAWLSRNLALVEALLSEIERSAPGAPYLLLIGGDGGEPGDGAGAAVWTNLSDNHEVARWIDNVTSRVIQTAVEAGPQAPGEALVNPGGPGVPAWVAKAVSDEIALTEMAAKAAIEDGNEAAARGLAGRFNALRWVLALEEPS